MENKPIIMIDSNYWIYLLDQGLHEHLSVKNYFDQTIDTHRIASSTVILLEVMHYLVKHLDIETAKEKWAWFLSINMLMDELTLQSLHNTFSEFIQNASTGIGSRDASILSSMQRLGNLTTIATHDKAFKKIDGITVIDVINN